MRGLQFRLLAAILVAFTLIGCGSGGGGDSDGDLNLTGTWAARVTINSSTDGANPAGAQFLSTLTLSDVSNTVTGTFVTESGLGGTVRGQTVGNLFSFTLVEGVNSCPKSCTGSAEVSSSDREFEGTYTCSDECGTSLSTSFSAIKN